MATPANDVLNRECFCISLDQEALARALDSEIGRPGLSELVRQRCPYLFASQPVFVGAGQLQQVAQVVRCVEWVVNSPAYREEALAAAPAVAKRARPGPKGVFFGYDFHLNNGHLCLIEINTNAGGAMLNAALARAHRACCPAMEGLVPTRAKVAAFENQIVAMFRNEWKLAGKASPLTSIAIVDDAPEQQYLYPEFLLFQELFERHAIRVVITDPAELAWREGALWHGDLRIDLAYNRLTDFYLSLPGNAVLREAYLRNGVVVTPHPHAYALFSDKRRLALLGDSARLRAWGVPEGIQEVLRTHLPRTEVVCSANAERLWSERRRLFFKPATGFGSKGAYRGDKLTRRVWQQILAREYVAQSFVVPGQRRVDESDWIGGMKFDMRAYVYDATVQWVAARLYQGQTTNFRTPGGGFAPVYSTIDASGQPGPVSSSGAEHAPVAGDANHAPYPPVPEAFGRADGLPQPS